MAKIKGPPRQPGRKPAKRIVLGASRVDDSDEIFTPAVGRTLAPPPHIDPDEIPAVASPQIFDASTAFYTPFLPWPAATVTPQPKQPKKPGRKATPEELLQECQAALEAHWGELSKKPKQKSGTNFVDKYLKSIGRSMGDTTIERRVVRPVWRKLFG